MGTYTSTIYDEAETDLAAPWPRFWARLFDLTIYSLPLGFLVGLAFPTLVTSLPTDPKISGYLFSIMLLPVVLLLDAVILSQLGSSPGKAIAGLYVGDVEGNRLTLETSIKRNALLYGKGLVLGIPLLCLLGYSAGYNAVKESGITSWDEETDSRVFNSGNNFARTALIAILAVMIIAFGRALDAM